MYLSDRQIVQQQLQHGVRCVGELPRCNRSRHDEAFDGRFQLQLVRVAVCVCEKELINECLTTRVLFFPYPR